MRAVVIGCNGYLGKHLSSILIQNNWTVIGYDKDHSPLLSLSEYHKLDLGDKSQISNLRTDVDYIFYFSGITGTSKAYDSYEQFIDINEKGLMHVLDLMRTSETTARIIFPSTRLVYKGNKDIELVEEAEKEFKTIYALNKWFGEQTIQQYGNYYGIKYTIFRICIPYGNELSSEYSYGTVGFFMTRALEKKNIILFGTGEQKRSFTYVGDICKQIYKTILNPLSENDIFNISGETYSLLEVAKFIAVKFDVNVENTEWPELEKTMESGDTIFNSQKISNLIGSTITENFSSWLNKLIIR